MGDDIEWFVDGTLAKCLQCDYVVWHNRHLEMGRHTLICQGCGEQTKQVALARCHEGGYNDA